MDIELVWDYPRPPRVEPVPERIRVVVDGTVIADSTRAVRVLETSHPPTYYVPSADVRMDLLSVGGSSSVCEWKGTATHHDLALGERQIPVVAWSYERPSAGFEVLQRPPSPSTRVGSTKRGWATSGRPRKPAGSTAAGSRAA